MRLTKRDRGGNAVMDCHNCEIKYRENCCSVYLCRNALIEKLAAYEDMGLSPEEIKLNMDGLDEYHKAEAEGRLMILPCKVGDMVYALERFCDGNRGDCDSWLRCEECKDYQQEVIERRIGTLSQAVSVIEMLGKTVFLTRDKAEAALKGETR